MELNHPVFSGPFPVELDLEPIDTPSNYAHYHQDPPLPARLQGWRVHGEIVDADGRTVFGSVAVGAGFGDTPDAEVISGGVNTKGPDWVAIGRHGNFFLWGFAASPSQLTESGRQVLSNSIVYISAFDRQPPRSKRRHIGRSWWLDQAVQFRDIASEHARIAKLQAEQNTPPDSPWAVGSLEAFVEKTARRSFPSLWDELGDDLEAYLPAMVENRGFLYAQGREFAAPILDRDAQAYGLANHDPRLLDHCIGLLERDEDVGRARRVLNRYTGLELGSAVAWRAWFDEVRDGLYFSDTSGYRFFSTLPSEAELRSHLNGLAVPFLPGSNPVHASAALVPEAGSSLRATLVVRIQVEPRWHIYASAHPGSPYVETDLTPELPTGWQAEEAWSLPSSQPSREDPKLRLWQGDLVFRRGVVADAPEALASGLEVELRYQACDANQCLPPEVVTLRADLPASELETDAPD